MDFKTITRFKSMQMNYTYKGDEETFNTLSETSSQFYDRYVENTLRVVPIKCDSYLGSEYFIVHFVYGVLAIDNSITEILATKPFPFY